MTLEWYWTAISSIFSKFRLISQIWELATAKGLQSECNEQKRRSSISVRENTSLTNGEL